MPKKDTAKQRLKHAIARAKNPEPDYMALLRPNTERPSKPNLNDPVERAIRAEVATNFYPWYDDSLRAAFEAFGLDPRDPFNWTKLLRILADIHGLEFDQRRPDQGSQDRATNVAALQEPGSAGRSKDC